MKRFITHIMGLCEQSRVGTHAGLGCLERREGQVALIFLLWLKNGTEVMIPKLHDLNFPTDSKGRNARAFLLTCPDTEQGGEMG